jgi:hypothetical protein
VALKVHYWQKTLLEWIKVVGPIVLSWPAVGLVAVLAFQDPIERALNRFSDTSGSTAEIGPIKVTLGTAVLPPQFRNDAPSAPNVEIDMSILVGNIRSTGAEATTAAFAIAYAMQAEFSASGSTIELSPRSIYEAARRYDDFPGTAYEGTSLIGALKAIQNEGAWKEEDWPYSSEPRPLRQPTERFSITQYQELGDLQEIIGSLKDGHVVVVTVAVTPDFDKVQRDGLVTVRTPVAELGQKAIAIVGYSSKTAEFRFANDWGTNWGDSGFGRIRDSDLTRLIRNAYNLSVRS